MTSPDEMSKETSKALLDFAHARCEYEHKELSETWKQLDSKAQATAAIGGAFLAAAFIFVRNSALSLDSIEKLLLALTILLLSVSILYAVIAMQVGPVLMPLGGRDTASCVRDILLLNEHGSLPMRERNLLADTVAQWSAVNETIRKSLITKGCKTRRSQVSLIAAGLSITLMTIHAIKFQFF